MDLAGNKHPSYLCGLPSQEVTGGSDDTYQLVSSFNSLLHKDLIHICGTGLLVWGIVPPNSSVGDRGK